MDGLYNRSMANLEFPELLDLVSRFAGFEDGCRALRGLRPSSDAASVSEAHSLVADLRKLLEKGESLGFSSMPVVRPALDLLRIEGVALDVQHILDLRGMALICADARRTVSAGASESPPLADLLKRLPRLDDLAAYVAERVDPGGEIPDRASPELGAVRRSLRALSDQIHESYQKILQKAEKRGALQDHYVTIRNERFVIPVKNEVHGAVAGVVHGGSSSGLTVYTEPFEMVPLNNRFLGLREREQEIVRQVLAQVTAFLRARHDDLESAYGWLCFADTLVARARFAMDFQCVTPHVGDGVFLKMEDARHPLLEDALRERRGKIVPISLSLTRERPCLIISGPNTGGKTAALKTAGLLALMALSGIPVPAARMECSPFFGVSAIIGDRQSISRDLSTFSSHVLLLRDVLEAYRHPTLVLADELGSGTDPEEGGALAMAVLDYLARLGAPVVTTTHWQSLKDYAVTTEGVSSAAVEIDPDTLEPTYRLHQDVLGGSSGLFIARKLGLPEEVVRDADRRVEGRGRISDRAYSRLNELVHMREAELEEAARIRHDSALRKIEMEHRLEERKIETAKALRDEFHEVVRRFEEDKTRLFEEIRATVRDEAQPPRRLERMEAQVDRLLRGLEREAVPLVEPERKLEPEGGRTPLEKGRATAGTRVWVGPMSTSGVVLEETQGDVVVAAGAKRVRVPLSWLFSDSGTHAEPTPPTTAPTWRTRPAEPDPEEGSFEEINLIGKTVDEALPELDRFLDAAFRQENRRVSVVHGSGKGVLRQAVRGHLQGLPYVLRFHHPPRSEGGEGKTLVELDV